MHNPFNKFYCGNVFLVCVKGFCSTWIFWKDIFVIFCQQNDRYQGKQQNDILNERYISIFINVKLNMASSLTKVFSILFLFSDLLQYDRFERFLDERPNNQSTEKQRTKEKAGPFRFTKYINPHKGQTWILVINLEGLYMRYPGTFFFFFMFLSLPRFLFLSQSWIINSVDW